MYALLARTTLCLPQELAPETTQVLFLGNSYTGGHNLTSLVEGFAAAAGHPTRTERNPPAG